jgi:hypothetical protein
MKTERLFLFFFITAAAAASGDSLYYRTELKDAEYNNSFRLYSSVCDFGGKLSAENGSYAYSSWYFRSSFAEAGTAYYTGILRELQRPFSYSVNSSVYSEKNGIRTALSTYDRKLYGLELSLFEESLKLFYVYHTGDEHKKAGGLAFKLPLFFQAGIFAEQQEKKEAGTSWFYSVNPSFEEYLLNFYLNQTIRYKNESFSVLLKPMAALQLKQYSDPEFAGRLFAQLYFDKISLAFLSVYKTYAYENFCYSADLKKLKTEIELAYIIRKSLHLSVTYSGLLYRALPVNGRSSMEETVGLKAEKHYGNIKLYAGLSAEKDGYGFNPEEAGYCSGLKYDNSSAVLSFEYSGRGGEEKLKMYLKKQAGRAQFEISGSLYIEDEMRFSLKAGWELRGEAYIFSVSAGSSEDFSTYPGIFSENRDFSLTLALSTKSSF